MQGWHEAFQWQWNSNSSLVGFILAYALHQLAPAARATIDNAISVFEIFGNHFAVAASAADVTRTLITKADLLDFGTGAPTSMALTPPLPDQVDAFLGPLELNAIGDPLLMDESPTMFPDTLAGAMGLA
ncbi:hypothetical protein BDV06DRAFT_223976 [Aspergillus oleicola]